jgi:hypothetical protein
MRKSTLGRHFSKEAGIWSFCGGAGLTIVVLITHGIGPELIVAFIFGMIAGFAGYTNAWKRWDR